jgi:predicted metal-dependent phosphoesterase TrpH
VTVSASGLRVDLHNHTFHSADGTMAPSALLEAARAAGVAYLAVTDHDTIRGGVEALALAEADPTLPRVIPGVEVRTEVGEIIGLYVVEEIPRGLPLEEAVARIRAQGGLVYLPHPFDVFRRGTISRTERDRAAQLADIIEVVNGRALGPRAERKSDRLARDLGKSRGAGSDAHHAGEVGRAAVSVAEGPTRETLVELVGAGTLVHRLDRKQYTLNWGRQASAPATRLYRRAAGKTVGR